MSNHIIEVSKITSNRQVTIPKEIMKHLKLKVGDQILWIERNKDIIVKKGKIVVEEPCVCEREREFKVNSRHQLRGNFPLDRGEK